MKCMSCGNVKGNVWITEMVNNVPKQYNLCINCAKKFGANYSASFNDIFAKFDEIMKASDALLDAHGFPSHQKPLKLPPAPQELTCDNCGMTLSEFRKRMRIGCAKDYELFDLGPILDKIHGTSVHMGKVPGASNEEQLKKLKRDMEVAVKSERYEEAANIRDQIKQLERS